MSLLSNVQRYYARRPSRAAAVRRARVEMLYDLRCEDCASAYHNLGRTIWRLNGSIELDVRLLPAPAAADPMPQQDFELYCLIEYAQRARQPHALTQELLDAMAATTHSTGEEVWQLAARLGVELTDMTRIVAESAPAVRQALARATLLDPVRVPAFLIDDEHLLHGNASPAFLHDVLQTLAEPQTTTARTRQQTGSPGA